MNIIFRLADYCFNSAMSYQKIRKEDIQSSVKVDVPDAEAFVIYTGRRKIENDVLSPNQEFFGGHPDNPALDRYTTKKHSLLFMRVVVFFIFPAGRDACNALCFALRKEG